MLSYWITLSLNLADDAEEVISWLWITACCHLQFLMDKTQQSFSKCWMECVQSQPREEYLSVPMVDGPPQLESLWEKNLSEAPRCARGSAQREDLGRIGWFCAAEDVDEAAPNVGRVSGRQLWEARAWSWREGGRQPQPMVDREQLLDWANTCKEMILQHWNGGGYIVITVNGSLLTQHP